MEEESIFKTLWNSAPTLEWRNMDISAYQYMLDLLEAFGPIPESDKAQEITDNIIEEYFE